MRAAIICAIACAMLAVQTEAAAKIAAITVTKYTTITKYGYTANPSHAKATVSVEDMKSNAADVDATGAAATATAALAEGSGMPAGDLPALSSAEQLSQAPVLASGTANVGPTASGSNSVAFTFSPMTLAPEKSKDMASARNNAAVASKPAVASAKTSDSDMMAVNKMVVAAVVAVAGLAVL